jgi:hypothetical protein
MEEKNCGATKLQVGFVLEKNAKLFYEVPTEGTIEEVSVAQT